MFDQDINPLADLDKSRGADLCERLADEKKLKQLLTEIDDKYARSILADFKRAHAIDQCSGLTCAFGNRVLDHCLFGMPLAFPSAVAELYLENPSAGDSAYCQQCHYRLPRSYFKFCPLCKGVVYG